MAGRYGQRDERIAWLLEHPAEWTGAPSLSDDVTDDGRAIIVRIVAQFKALGLMPNHGSLEIAKESVRRAIGVARQRQREA